MTDRKICKRCNGWGREVDDRGDLVKCPACKGSGDVCRDCDGYGSHYNPYEDPSNQFWECQTCKGYG